MGLQMFDEIPWVRNLERLNKSHSKWHIKVAGALPDLSKQQREAYALLRREKCDLAAMIRNHDPPGYVGALPRFPKSVPLYQEQRAALRNESQHRRLLEDLQMTLDLYIPEPFPEKPYWHYLKAIGSNQRRLDATLHYMLSVMWWQAAASVVDELPYLRDTVLSLVPRLPESSGD